MPDAALEENEMTNGNRPIDSRHRENGAALIVSLVLLLVLTMLGLSAMSTTTLEERMAGNMQNRMLAFQAGEAALREGEFGMAPLTEPPGICASTPCGDGNVWQTGALDELDDDLALRDSEWWKTATGKSVSNEYKGIRSPDGTAAGYPDVAENPRFTVEHRHFDPDTASATCTSYSSPCTGRHFYRITARGVGKNENADAIVQSTYAKRFN